MRNERGQKVADLLRERVGYRVADRFEDCGSANVEFGDHVEVFISEKFGGSTIEAGVNWSAIGTVSAALARDMSLRLNQAAEFVEAVQQVIDGEQDIDAQTDEIMAIEAELGHDEEDN